MKLGIPGSLTVVCEVGHSRESHGSLLGLGTQDGIGHSRESHGRLKGISRSVGIGHSRDLTAVCGVGHSRESHGSLLGTPGSLTVVCWDWALQGVSR